MSIAEALIKLKSGTISRLELDLLTKEFIPLARQIALYLAPKSKRDDFISAAYFGIAYAFNKAAEKMVDDDLESWVKSCIYRFVRRESVTNHMICVPNTTMRDARKRGEEIKPMKEQPLTDLVPCRTRYQEILDNLDKVSEDNEDREIILLREQGFKDCEIASQLSLSPSEVYRRRKRIESRFDRLMRRR